MVPILVFLTFFFSFVLQAADMPAKNPTPEKKAFKFEHDGSIFDLTFYFFPEFVYGKNLTLLNNRNPDELVIFRHFIDSFATYTYGNATREFFKAKCCVRSRSVWGNNLSVLETIDSRIEELGTTFGTHRHGMLLNEMWIRELWMEFSLSDLLGIPFCQKHILTCGAFFFEIGRGISLGAIYPSMPPALGFFIDTQIDQYAFGAKLSGEIIKDQVTYDIYGALFNNRSATFEETNRLIRDHEYGYRGDSARGFGSINYVVASQVQWYPIKENDQRKILLEPYVVYNHNPEVRLDLLHDGISDLATFGLMCEWSIGSVEGGFEGAFNRGQLHAFGIDRNMIVLENNDDKVVIADDQVLDKKTESDALVTDANQKAIALSPFGAQQNGKMINDMLQNKKFRFRDPFEVRYRGAFFVADASYIFCKDIFKVSAALGIATGGEDPRKALALGKSKSVDYTGFITLNESYAGKRVASVLFFNGFGTFPRIIDIGLEGLLPDATVLNITGFTNLMYLGASCDYNYKNNFQRWRLCPNLLFYWHEQPACKYESKKHSRIPDAFIYRPKILDTFLGTEINIIGEIEVLKDLTFFILGGLFIPGFHFRQIKGMPLNDAQAVYIQEKKGPRESLLGNDNAFVLDIGIKFTF